MEPPHSTVSSGPGKRRRPPSPSSSYVAPEDVTPGNVLSVISDEQAFEYKQIFEIIDDDGSGEVTVDELYDCFVKMEVEMDRAEIESMLAEIDEDASGSIDFEEFSVMLFRMEKGLMTKSATAERDSEPHGVVLVVQLSSVQALRVATYDLFSKPESSVWAGRLSYVILVLIFVSCTAFVLETIPQFYEEPGITEIFFNLETFCIVCFTVEYIIRLATAPNWSTFLRSWMNTIDFVAILPFYLEIVLPPSTLQGFDTKFLRLVRLNRILRMGQFKKWFNTFRVSIEASMSPLLMVLGIMVISLVFFGALLYNLEGGVTWHEEVRQDLLTNGEQSVFQSIPGTFWFCITTMTTVGYGDRTPKTALGKAMSIMLAVYGILLMAVPISVISANFKGEYDKMINQAAIKKSQMKKLQEARAEVEEEVEGQLASRDKDAGTDSASSLHELYLSSIFSLCRGNQKRMLSKLKDAEVANRGRLVTELANIGQDFLLRRPSTSN